MNRTIREQLAKANLNLEKESTNEPANLDTPPVNPEHSGSEVATVDDSASSEPVDSDTAA